MKARREKDSTKNQKPESKRIKTRIAKIRNRQRRRNQEITKRTEAKRDNKEKDHHQSMKRDQSIVNLELDRILKEPGKNRKIRDTKLKTNKTRKSKAKKTRAKRKDHVEQSKQLMISCSEEQVTPRQSSQNQRDAFNPRQQIS